MLKYSILPLTALLFFTSCVSSQQKIVDKSQDINKPQKRVNYAPTANNYQLISYINQIRSSGAKCTPSAPPLQLDQKLQNAAFSHSIDMATNKFLKHNGSGTYTDAGKPKMAQNSSFVDRIIYFGYSTKVNLLVGENITYTRFKYVKSDNLMKNFKKAVDNWIEDDEHCRILMNPRFKYAGIGYKKTDDRYYFTLDLAEPINKY